MIKELDNMTKIEIPLFITLPRKTKEDKKYFVNLNNYRNWHYIVNNQIKEKYKDQLFNNLTGLKLENKIKLHFILRPANKRRIDRSNILSIHEKFFCDALVAYGCIKDDNDNFIEETRYTTGEIDKDFPRVEIIIS